MLMRWSFFDLPRKRNRMRAPATSAWRVAERREAERAVLARVALVADPDERRREQPHDGGEHLRARHARQREIAPRARADARQRRAERAQAAVLRLVAHLAPARVIAILLAAARVARRRLDVAVRRATDPHVAPRRRHDEAMDAAELLAIAHERAVGRAVAEADRRLFAADAGLGVAHVAKSRITRRGDRLGDDRARLDGDGDGALRHGATARVQARCRRRASRDC